MIESTFIRLDRAAEMLGTDADTLLIAAAEQRILLRWLLNRFVAAELGYFHIPENPEPDEPFQWIVQEITNKPFKFVPLTDADAAELLKRNAISGNIDWLSEPDERGYLWRPKHGDPVAAGSLTDDDVYITRDIVFAKRADIENICSRGAMPPEHAVQGTSSPLHRHHISDKLAKMNQAAAKFWLNADRADRTTHTDNSTVSTWLVKHGFSSTLADKAATLIRPDWVPSGRRPED